MEKIQSYAALSATSPLTPFSFNNKNLGDHDVLIDIMYCGICHSDVHIARNEWKNTLYPVVPGHEIVGRIKEVGKDVRDFSPGDLVGVGCIIGSCQACASCQMNLEQYCEKGFTLTFNSRDAKGETNYGGFSQQITVEDKYVIRIPEEFKEKDLAAVAPLLCAGITTYSPLKHWKVGPGVKVGIVGLGGLGHMAVKLAHALGAHVTVFTTSANKALEAKNLGADEVVVSTEKNSMRAHVGTFHFILDTVSFVHDLNQYLALLAQDGAMCLVGLPSEPYKELRADLLVSKRKSLAGSLIGGIQETEELIQFCAKHQVLSEIELITMDQVNVAFDRIIKGDVKYRFVIDIQNSLF